MSLKVEEGCLRLTTLTVLGIERRRGPPDGWDQTVPLEWIETRHVKERIQEQKAESLHVSVADLLPLRLIILAFSTEYIRLNGLCTVQKCVCLGIEGDMTVSVAT